MELKRIAFGLDTSTRNRLRAIKELLRREPAGSEELELGSVWHVYSDRVYAGVGVPLNSLLTIDHPVSSRMRWRLVV